MSRYRDKELQGDAPDALKPCRSLTALPQAEEGQDREDDHDRAISQMMLFMMLS